MEKSEAMPTSPFTQPVVQIIKQRYSCRRYLEAPIDEERRNWLAEAAASRTTGPLGTQARLVLVATTRQGDVALHRLGTYGFIHNPTGFIVGAVGPGERNLEDLGYLMERIVLMATDLGLGTCWVGGIFTRSGFARAIRLHSSETLPAVVATGLIDNTDGPSDVVRRVARSDERLPWESLFYDGRWGVPLARQGLGPYAEALEMVRLGPSASNKQPWRILRQDSSWHFYLRRTPRYKDGFFMKLGNVPDLQRIDMGIAMCHFELAAVEQGLAGQWQVLDPALETPGGLVEYAATWKGC